MTITLSALEQSMVDAGATHLIRADDMGVTRLIDTGLLVYTLKAPLEGPSLGSYDGIFSRPSFRMTGNSYKNPVFQQPGPAICPPGEMSIVMVLSNIRNVLSSGSSRVFSCTQSGGYALAILSTGNLALDFYMSGSYRHLEFDKNLLDSSGSLLHIINDRRYINVYINGSLVSSLDNGAYYNMSYAGGVYVIIGAEPSSGSSVDGSIDYGDFDFSLFGVFSEAIDEAVIASQYQIFSSSKMLVGTALLDDGSAASAVDISEWLGPRRAKVVPDSSGSWDASVPAGDYLVTAVGPAGYRPISHGPVTAVDP